MHGVPWTTLARLKADEEMNVGWKETKSVAENGNRGPPRAICWIGGPTPHDLSLRKHQPQILPHLVMWNFPILLSSEAQRFAYPTTVLSPFASAICGDPNIGTGALIKVSLGKGTESLVAFYDGL